MTQEHVETLLFFFKALANESRLKILGILADRECGVEELATLLGLKAPTVSNHLSMLKELGVVHMRAEGNDRLYRLDLEGLRGMSRNVFSSLRTERMAELAEGVSYDRWERKVLDTFVDVDQIHAIPAGYKKRLVLLKWVADHFEEGRTYTESEVNETIERHYPDYCTLRREMVNGKLMAREDGIYRRLQWEMPELAGGGRD